MMDNIRVILENLDTTEQDYVWERSKASSNAQAYKAIGMSSSSYYLWSQDKREYLNGLAEKLRLDRKLRAEMILEERLADAAKVKVDGLKSRKEHIRQKAATEILEWFLKRPAQPIELQSIDFTALSTAQLEALARGEGLAKVLLMKEGE